MNSMYNVHIIDGLFAVVFLTGFGQILATIVSRCLLCDSYVLQCTCGDEGYYINYADRFRNIMLHWWLIYCYLVQRYIHYVQCFCLCGGTRRLSYLRFLFSTTDCPSTSLLVSPSTFIALSCFVWLVYLEYGAKGFKSICVICPLFSVWTVPFRYVHMYGLWYLYLGSNDYFSILMYCML
jgi:hypothetical protein